MKISASQMNIFKVASMERFVGRLETLVHSQVEPGDQFVRQKCAQYMEVAKKYAFETEFEISAYVLCAFAFGPGFPEDERMYFKSILAQAKTSPRLKAAQMMKALELGGFKEA
jgi:hypothetical protein